MKRFPALFPRKCDKQFKMANYSSTSSWKQTDHFTSDLSAHENMIRAPKIRGILRHLFLASWNVLGLSSASTPDTAFHTSSERSIKWFYCVSARQSVFIWCKSWCVGNKLNKNAVTQQAHRTLSTEVINHQMLACNKMSFTANKSKNENSISST